MQLLKNDMIECTVDTLGIYGEGIAHVEGRTVFIRGALPNERVRAKIVFARPTFCDAKLVAVLESSPARETPRCRVFGACGGCALQHMTYAAELDYKKARLEETLQKIARIEIDSLPPVPSPTRTRYRNKLSLPVRKGRDGAVIGFFARDSHRVVPIDDCLLQPDFVQSVIAATKTFLTKTGLNAYDETTGSGDVRHVTARHIGDILMVTLVSTHTLNAAQSDTLAETVRAACGENVRVYNNVNAKKTNVIYGDKWRQAYGGTEPIAVNGILTDVHPASFFQVNDDVRKKLYDAVLDECAGAQTVIDAYAGAGLLTAKLAESAHAVGIELDPAAAASARRTAELNGIVMDNREGDCAELLPIALGEFPDATVVLDPPRQGVDARAIDAITASRAKKIVYVSCNPATLARDVDRLRKGGFKLERTQVFDMFPMTVAMETLTVLTRE